MHYACAIEMAILALFAYLGKLWRCKKRAKA